MSDSCSSPGRVPRVLREVAHNSSLDSSPWRPLGCGHFCHHRLVQCLLWAELHGHVQSSLVCPMCRHVTFLSRKAALWPPGVATNQPQTLEVPLSPSSLSHLAKSQAGNTLVVPSDLVVPVQGPERRSQGPVLARGAHIFVISDHGMALVATACGSLGRRSGADTSSLVSSSPALGLKCSPMALAVMLVLAVALLAALLPWLLLVRRDL
ncbi:LOW QUALITY PROTEIN: RING finger protein 222-like [Sylvia borin]